MNMFDLAMPWWEFVIRALAVYLSLLVMVRISGKRTFGQFTAFDMILLILLGTAVQNSLIGDDISLLGGLILAATLITVNFMLGMLASRSRKLHSLIEGTAAKVAENGRVDYRKLRSEEVSPADFEEAIRRSGLDSHAEIGSAWIETDGSITIIKAK
jgi:uncharacterized membrane protein YcaP (DUF421 family)